MELKGLSKIETKSGDVFDAEFHEAITQIPAPSDDLKGKVVGFSSDDENIPCRMCCSPEAVLILSGPRLLRYFFHL